MYHRPFSIKYLINNTNETEIHQTGIALFFWFLIRTFTIYNTFDRLILGQPNNQHFKYHSLGTMYM